MTVHQKCFQGPCSPSMHCAPCKPEKTFRIVEDRCLQYVESIFINLPHFVKSGVKESLKGSLGIFLYILLDIWSGIESFGFWVFVSLLNFRWRCHQNVRLEDCLDGGRRITLVSVNPFFRSLDRWERSSWLQILQTPCLPSSFYIECSIVNRGPVEISWKQNKRVNLTWTMLYLI